MKKSILVIAGCVVCVIAFQAFSVKHEPKWTNLKVLPQDIPKEDLDSIMHHFSRSLGVRCDFCHVRNEAEKKMDFAADDKPEKDIARHMMRMAIDINKKFFSGEAAKEMDDHMGMGDSANNEAGVEVEKVKMKKGKMKVKGDDKKMKVESDGDMKGMNMMPMDTYSKDIKYMLMEVNCYTCHRGDAHPNSKLPPPPPRPQAPPPGEQPAQPAPPANN